MSMPETPMYEDHLLSLEEGDVWMPRQSLVMKSIPITHCMKQPSHNELWFGVAATNSRHAL
jgi:hypothetical protein